MKAIGHGRRSEITPAEALDIARDATSTAAEHLDPEEPNGFKPGEAVTVNAEDYGRDKVAGTLVASSATRVAIRRNGPPRGRRGAALPPCGLRRAARLRRSQPAVAATSALVFVMRSKSWIAQETRLGKGYGR